MTSAAALTAMMRTPEGDDKRNGNPNAIYAVIEDGPIAHRMTMGMIDAWWESLAPSERADIYERWINADQIAEAEQVEASFAAFRDPLGRIVQAAERMIERNSRAFVPYLPTLSRAESALLRRSTQRNDDHATV